MLNLSDGSETLARLNEQNEQQPAPLKLRLTDLKLYRLGDSEAPDARHATHAEFFGFISSLVGFRPGVDTSKWTVTRRRDVLNWCIMEGLLEPNEGVLSRIKNSPLVEFIAPINSTEEVQAEN